MADHWHDPDQRPSPEALLEAARREESPAGRLKIFVGAAPGVGKTYEMLQQARARKADGYDVVVGVVETHGRKETLALIEGLEGGRAAYVLKLHHAVSDGLGIMQLLSRVFTRDRDDAWSAEMTDRQPDGPVICHNDVCLENVVFRAGAAVALLDFDFAAPGRPSHDLACFARMCVPVDDEASRANLGWNVARLPDRLRLIADAYGCSPGDRREIISSLDYTIARGGEFVRRHAEAGEPGFVEMWASIGGMARFDRRRDWWARHGGDFAATMAP